MIGINIITKEGILLFSHFFLSVFSDVDGDLRAGLTTAVLNAMKETQANQGIKVIDQGRYFVHIAEGELTYCLLFSQDNALTEHRFAQSILKQFEVLFGDYVATQVSFSETEFNDFSKYSMFHVQMGCRNSCNKKLAAIGVWSCIGHRQ